jgi:orotidine-5'-phosphate decarboxylase
MKSYQERAKAHPNEVARLLLETMVAKQSNLCVSVDLAKKADLLKVVDLVGPYVCLIKVCICCVTLEGA